MLQTPKMMVVRLVKWIIAWEKKTDLVKDVKSIVGFNFELDGMTSHKQAWRSTVSVSKWRPQRRILGFFQDELLQDNSHFRGGNFGGWKNLICSYYWWFPLSRHQKQKS